MVDVLQLATFIVILVIGIAWYLSYSAARLDRLHAKAEGAMSALDAALVRRAEAALELANNGALDPASALLIADAATESIEALKVQLEYLMTRTREDVAQLGAPGGRGAQSWCGRFLAALARPEPLTAVTDAYRRTSHVWKAMLSDLKS